MYEGVDYLKVWHVTEPVALLVGDCGHGMYHT